MFNGYRWHEPSYWVVDRLPKDQRELGECLWDGIEVISIKLTNRTVAINWREADKSAVISKLIQVSLSF